MATTIMIVGAWYISYVICPSFPRQSVRIWSTSILKARWRCTNNAKRRSFSMVPQRRNSALLKMVVICLTGLLFTGNLFAHGNDKHVMGTVKSVSADAIVVEATSHETETVQVTSETKFVKAGQPSSLSELKTGDPVVIHPKPSADNLEPTEVKFEPPPTPSATK